MFSLISGKTFLPRQNSNIRHLKTKIGHVLKQRDWAFSEKGKLIAL